MNAPEHTSGLTSCPEGAAGYLSNSDRFHSDTVGEEYAIRQEARAKLLKVQEHKRYLVNNIIKSYYNNYYN